MAIQIYRRRWGVLLASVVLLTLCSEHGYPQLPARAPDQPPQAARPGGYAAVAPPSIERVATATPTASPSQNAPPTTEQLIALLEDLRKQKEAIERMEKQVGEQLREALQRQKDRLAKLGVTGPDPSLIQGPSQTPSAVPAGYAVPPSSPPIPLPLMPGGR
jgi:hypothetical protein